MRVVHIGHFYGLKNTGGAAIGATNFHLALLEAGVESFFLCLHNRGVSSPNVIEVPCKGSLSRWAFIVATKVLRNVWRFTPFRRPLVLDCIPSGMVNVVRRLKPDIVHVHWVSGDGLSLAELEKMPCPVVVHLHDFWMLGGFCPWGENERRFYEGFTRKNSTWVEWNLNMRKQRFIKNKKVEFAVASHWGADVCRRSFLGRERPVSIIPYVINPAFRYDRTLCSEHSKFIVLFGCYGGRGNAQKGFNELAKALTNMEIERQKKIELNVFGESGADTKVGEVVVKFLGPVFDPVELVRIYHSADVFAFPSITETFGQTKVEAMLCGLPVVAFNRSACSEGIVHLKTGWVADPSHDSGFLLGLEHYFGLWERGELDRDEVAKVSATFFSKEETVKKLLNIYKRNVV